MAQAELRADHTFKLLQVYCAALYANVRRTMSSDQEWCERGAELLHDAALDLRLAAYSLQGRAQAMSQPSLPLPDTQAIGIDAVGFKERFPSLETEDAEKVVAAYERITALAPSIVLFPDILQEEVRNLVRAGGELGAAEAVVYLDLEQRLRTVHRTQEDVGINFHDQLRARLIALNAEDALSDDGFAQLDRFLDASKNLFPPL